MSKLKIRVMSALVGAVLVLLVIFSTPIVFHIMVVLASFLMLHELHQTFQHGVKWQLVALNYVFAVFMLVLPITPLAYRTDVVLFLLTVYLMLTLFCSVLWHDKVSFANVTQSVFMMLYVVVFPVFLTYIRMMEEGLILIFLPLLGAWMPDTFAYFIGCRFGRHKLIPSVSPNKTVEGAVGAVFGGLLMFVVYGVLLQYVFSYTVHYPALLILALICSVVAQFGDLSASVIKREFEIKDFGNIIPGHGGILDRVDSLLFVAPVVYYFLLIFEVVCK